MEMSVYAEHRKGRVTIAYEYISCFQKQEKLHTALKQQKAAESRFGFEVEICNENGASI